MDAFYKYALLGLAAALCASAQSNLSAPVTVFPPAATDPACMRLREQLTNGSNFMAFCPPNAIASDFVFQFPKWDGELSGTTSTDSFVRTRRFLLSDQLGAAASWSMIASVDAVSSDVSLIDNTGSIAVKYQRRVAGVPAHLMSVYMDLAPNADATWDLGASGLRWKDGYFSGNLTAGGIGNFNSLSIGGTSVITSGRATAAGLLYGATLQPTGSTIDLGTSILGFRTAYLDTSLRMAGVLTINSSRDGFFHDMTVTGTCTGCGTGTTLPVVDTTAVTKGSGDATKLLRFENDTNIPTGTTYTMIVPVNPGTFAVTDATQTFTAAPTFAASLLVSGTRDSGTAAAPWHFTYANEFLTETYVACNVLSTSSNCWNTAVDGGNTFRFTSTSGLVLALDPSGPIRTLVDFNPNTNAALNLGSSTRNYNIVHAEHLASDLTTVIIDQGLTTTGFIIPLTDNTYDIGSGSGPTRYWKDLYIKGNFKQDIAGSPTTTINNLGQFVGQGVAVAANGVGGGAFNPWNGGGYDTGLDATIVIGVCTLTYNGGVLINHVGC